MSVGWIPDPHRRITEKKNGVTHLRDMTKRKYNAYTLCPNPVLKSKVFGYAKDMKTLFWTTNVASKVDPKQKKNVWNKWNITFKLDLWFSYLCSKQVTMKYFNCVSVYIYRKVDLFTWYQTVRAAYRSPLANWSIIDIALGNLPRRSRTSTMTVKFVNT